MTIPASKIGVRPRIVSFASDLRWTDNELDQLDELGVFHQVSRRPTTLAELIAEAGSAQYVIAVPIAGSILTGDLFQRLPSLRGIALTTTRKNWLDMDAVNKRGLSVTTLGDYAAISVAEFTIGLILDLARQTTRAAGSARSGNRWFGAFQGFELRGKTLGIIGLGSIGAQIALLAQGIGMKVVAFNRTPKFDNILQEPLQSVLQQSHIVSMSLELNEDTRCFLNRDRLSLIRLNAILVNVSPEGLIDQEAVYEMLTDSRLAAYGFELDELRTDPIQQRLIELDNVLATPHIAWYTGEALDRLRDEIIQNLRAMITGAEGRAMETVTVPVLSP